MSSLPSLITQGISLMEGNTSLSDFLHSQGVDQVRGWPPAVDIDESPATLLIKVNVAGVEDKDLDIDFFNNLLKVRGTRTRSPEEGLVCVKGEIPYGPFEREIMIPISVTSRESVSIETKNGILYVRIDKAREESNRFSMNVSSRSTSEQHDDDVNDDVRKYARSSYGECDEEHNTT